MENMNSELKNLVFDLPGIKLLQSYSDNGLIDINLIHALPRQRDRILVTYREPSEITQEIIKNEGIKTIKFGRLGFPIAASLAAEGTYYLFFRPPPEIMHIVSPPTLIVAFLYLLLLRRKVKKIKKFNLLDYFKEIHVDPTLKSIDEELKKSDNNFLKAAKVARENKMDYIAELYLKM